MGSTRDYNNSVVGVMALGESCDILSNLGEIFII
jgi:hypothetical protein